MQESQTDLQEELDAQESDELDETPHTHTPRPPLDPFAPIEGQDPEMPQVIRRLELFTRRRVENVFAGAYQAVFQGQGMVFADVRPYQPGDEVRSIDWNVSARMNELYVKQFTEERERTVLLLWDGSRSMFLGHQRRSKRELCAELAMVFAMSAIQSGDRVGLIIFTDKIERYIAPQRGRKHVMRMVRALLDFHPAIGASERTDIKEALLFLQRVAPRHTIAFLMSDFFAYDEDGVWQMLARRCEIIPIILQSSQERGLPENPYAPAQLFSESTPAYLLPAEDDEYETPMAQEQAPSPFGLIVTLSIGLFALAFGLWQGGLWQWTGGIAMGLCLCGAFFLQRQNSGGIHLLQELESHTPMAVDLLSTQTHEAFVNQAQEHIDDLRERFRRLQMDAVFLPAEHDYMPILLRFFKQRQRRG